MLGEATKKKKFNDARHDTYESRCTIGFANDVHTWQEEPAFYTEDTLVIQGHPVMESWERDYMKVLADIATSNGGTVLEVGFGMGISAEFIQANPISEHIVIEANNDVFKRLNTFAKSSIQPVRPLHGFWQEVTMQLPDNSLDGILFDTYPLTEEEIHQNHFTFFEEAFRLLRPGGILTYYSDEIDNFSPNHLAKLREAGFTEIAQELCQVTPPADCQYWKSNTILAPIIRK